MTLYSAGEGKDSTCDFGKVSFKLVHQKLFHSMHFCHIFVNCGAHRMVLLHSILCFQVQSSDVVLDVTVEHGLPELHSGPNHMLLHAAVGKLSNAGSQFLSDKHGDTCKQERKL